MNLAVKRGNWSKSIYKRPMVDKIGRADKSAELRHAINKFIIPMKLYQKAKEVEPLNDK